MPVSLVHTVYQKRRSCQPQAGEPRWLGGELVAARAPSRSGRCPACGTRAYGAKHRMIGVGRLYRKRGVHAGRIDSSSERSTRRSAQRPGAAIQPVRGTGGHRPRAACRCFRKLTVNLREADVRATATSACWGPTHRCALRAPRWPRSPHRSRRHRSRIHHSPPNRHPGAPPARPPCTLRAKPPARVGLRGDSLRSHPHAYRAGHLLPGSRRNAWALLLARIYEVFPLVCPICGAEMRSIAFLTDPATARAILAHLGEPTAPPSIAPARSSPLWDLPDAGAGGFDPHAQPAPEYEFDQRIAW
jgi:hypothetical protein